MQMSEFEIVASFRDAANKNKQIGILSDLNSCKPEDIMEILARHGAITGVKKKEPEKKEADKPKREKSTKWTPELDAEVSRLASEGLKITEIAERLGMNVQAIYDRRSALQKAISIKPKKQAIKKDKPKNEDSFVKGKDKSENGTYEKNYARKIVEILSICGWDVLEFKVDLLSSELSVRAKEKTAEAATPTVKEM